METVAKRSPSFPPSPLRPDLLRLEARLRGRYAPARLLRSTIAALLGFASDSAFGAHVQEFASKPYDGNQRRLGGHRARIERMTAILNDEAPAPAGCTWRDPVVDVEVFLAFWRNAGLVVERRGGQRKKRQAPAPIPVLIPESPAQALVSGAAAVTKTDADYADPMPAADSQLPLPESGHGLGLPGPHPRPVKMPPAAAAMLARLKQQAVAAVNAEAQRGDLLQLSRDAAGDRASIVGSLSRIEGLLERMLAVWEGSK